MAPEVYQGEEDYDSSVDMYSLGIVMYKLLNNNFEPFRTQLTEADENAALKSRMKNEQIPNPANANEDVAEVVLKACSYYAKDRFASAHDMRAALETIVAGNKPIINKKKVLPPIDLDEDDDSTRGMFGERKEKKEIEPPVIEEPKKQKNKYLALLLAFIPFNLFGIYQFYMNGKKKGLKRLCTLNFVYVGYFMDWYDAVKNFLNSNNN